MDLRLLRYFVGTVDAGSANRAATALRVTQPVLSRQLRQLERSLGVGLFERRGSRLVPTRAGEELLPLARDLLARADRVERAAAGLAAGGLSTLRLAVPSTTLNDVLAPFLARLTPEDPVPLVSETRGVEPERALAEGMDLVIAPRRPSGDVAHLPLAVLPVWAYVPPGHRWASRAAVTVEELADEPLVLLGEGFRPRALLDAAMEEAGLGYASVLECGDARVAQALARSGRGVAIVTDDPRFELVPLGIRAGGRALRIRLHAAWDPRHHAAASLEQLARRLAAYCVERYGPDVAPPA